ncbi:MAG: 3-oxoacyl-[acyl-carrier-protein] synthase, KASII, partial [uncultured Gemmatimonadaceae bacterium]
EATGRRHRAWGCHASRERCGDDLARAAGRALRGRADHPLRHGAVRRAVRVRGQGVRPARHDGPQGGQARGPVHAVRARRLGRGDARRRPRRRRRLRPRRDGRDHRERDRRARDDGGPARRVHGPRPEAHLAVLRPDVHRRHRRRRRVDALQRARAQLRDRVGVRDERARDRRLLPRDPERGGARDARRRLGGGGDADVDRRLRQHDRALHPQRLARHGVAPLRRHARRLRPRRGRGRGRARGARARAAARRAHLRRARRLRGHRRRLPPHRPAPGARGAAARDAAGAPRRRAGAGGRRLRQRPRDVDAAQRPERDARDQGGVRRPRARPERELDEERHRAHARRGRRRRVHRLRARHPGRRGPADDQLRDARPRLRPRLHAERAAHARGARGRDQQLRLRRAQRVARRQALRGV